MQTEPSVPAWLDPDLFPFQSRFVEVDGHRTHHTHILKGAGHYVQEHAATELSRTIRDWWKHESTAAEMARAVTGARA
jgi:hypothetical protein